MLSICLFCKVKAPKWREGFLQNNFKTNNLFIQENTHEGINIKKCAKVIP